MILWKKDKLSEFGCLGIHVHNIKRHFVERKNTISSTLSHPVFMLNVLSQPSVLPVQTDLFKSGLLKNNVHQKSTRLAS